MKLVLRSLTAFLVAMAVTLTAPFAKAQSLPDKVLTLIVPYPGGGSADTTARIIANEMSKKLGRSIIVLNKPGAATMVGTAEAAKAAPDGTTMLFAANTNLINNIALFDKLPYDPVNDFAPVARLVALPLMISANPKAPFKTLPEMVEYVRKNPDKVTRASAGVANITNIGLLYFEDVAKIKMWHVPYAGDAAAMQALISGEVDVYTTTVALMRQHVQSGRVRGLAILGKDAVRDSEVPDVPTVTEAGFPEFDVDSWYSIVVPAKTPQAAIAELNKAANDALKTPEVASQLSKFGVVPTGGTLADLQKLIDDNRARWVPAIRKLNIKAEQQP
ncbi:MAG: tripartite tricarboxylate transporter substrate-binding protein [Xanthobacteraceae bacterium]